MGSWKGEIMGSESNEHGKQRREDTDRRVSKSTKAKRDPALPSRTSGRPKFDKRIDENGKPVFEQVPTAVYSLVKDGGNWQFKRWWDQKYRWAEDRKEMDLNEALEFDCHAHGEAMLRERQMELVWARQFLKSAGVDPALRADWKVWCKGRLPKYVELMEIATRLDKSVPGNLLVPQDLPAELDEAWVGYVPTPEDYLVDRGRRLVREARFLCGMMWALAWCDGRKGGEPVRFELQRVKALLNVVEVEFTGRREFADGDKRKLVWRCGTPEELKF